jgi:hypothetical protein
MVHEPRLMKIHDMRPISHEIGLDTYGFGLVEQRSAVRDFWDDDEVRAVYYPEAAEFIKQALGASRVFIFDHVQRRRVDGVDRRQAGMPRQPATRVHVDHTARSGPQRVRDLLGDDSEELRRRDLLGEVQPGASMVLRARDAARRGVAAEMLRQQKRWARAVHAAYRLHRPDDPARRGAARKHRAALAGVPRELSGSRKAALLPVEQGRSSLGGRQ